MTKQQNIVRLIMAIPVLMLVFVTVPLWKRTAQVGPQKWMYIVAGAAALLLAIALQQLIKDAVERAFDKTREREGQSDD